MGLFRRKNKANSADTNRRSPSYGRQSRKVVSYYTATQRQLDNFERKSSQDNIAYSRFERIRNSWFTILVLAALLIIVGYMGILATKPHIDIKGTEYRSASEIETAIDNTFVGDIRNRVKPLLQESSLETKLTQLIPEAGTINVSSTLLGHRPEVTVTNDDPMAVFTQPDGTRYIISTRGRLLLPTSSVTSFDPASLPTIDNQTGVMGSQGEQFMRPDEAEAFIRLYTQYVAESSKPTFVLSAVPHELLAREPGRGTGDYAAKYLLNETIITQFGSLRAVEKKLGELGQKPSQYIDVRLADRVYYL